MSTDVCIVGAGAAGLLLASCLVRRGVSVVVLEAGGATCTGERGAQLEAIVNGEYRATTSGRAFGLGGTTSLWGGQLVPHSRLDFRSEAHSSFDFWRHAVEVIERQSDDVYATLGMSPTCAWFRPEECIDGSMVSALHRRGLEIVTADWLPFRRRNLTGLINQYDLDVFANAPAVAWGTATDPDGRVAVKRVTAQAADRRLEVSAWRFVVAAGAVETTRILLEIQRHAGRLLRDEGALGHYLSDHLSCRIGDVVESDRERCAAAFAPRFRAGRMRSFRFIERHPPPGAARAFLHFIYENSNPGFALAKKTLFALQARHLPSIPPREFLEGFGGLAALAIKRYVNRRLYIPAHTPSHLQLDIEQSPCRENRIELDTSHDALGRPRALVHWQIRPADEQAIRETASRCLAAWPTDGPGFPHLINAVNDVDAVKPHDVYHPVGTCRMGTDTTAVVDPDCRVHGTENLFLASTAMFPSAGTANPTFTMLCLAADLSERLSAARMTRGKIA